MRAPVLASTRCLNAIAGYVQDEMRLGSPAATGRQMLTRARLAVAIAAAVLVAHVALHAQQASLTSEVSRLVALLELPTNSVVGDLGAGSGEVSLEMARQLGPASRVYGTDINAQRIVEIKEAATKAGLTNVVALEGAPASTNLPDACCDALFVRHVYHHFADPPTMNRASCDRSSRAAASTSWTGREMRSLASHRRCADRATLTAWRQKRSSRS